VGAGAIGSNRGSFLSRAGHDVTIVDPWAEQVDTINRSGIKVTGPHDSFEARPKAVHLNDAAKLPRDLDIAFVAMKVYDTAWATQLAVRHLGPNGYVVASENCWPDPIVASIVGAERSVGLIMSKIGVACWKPGEVERGMERGGNKGHDVFCIRRGAQRAEPTADGSRCGLEDRDADHGSHSEVATSQPSLLSSAAAEHTGRSNWLKMSPLRMYAQASPALLAPNVVIFRVSDGTVSSYVAM
jgi:hypothetical protein